MSHQNQIGKLIQRLLRVVGANWENPLPSFNYYYINSLTVLRTCGILPPFSCPFPEAGSMYTPSDASSVLAAESPKGNGNGIRWKCTERTQRQRRDGASPRSPSSSHPPHPRWYVPRPFQQPQMKTTCSVVQYNIGDTVQIGYMVQGFAFKKFI